MSNKHEFKNSSSLLHCDYNDAEGVLEICFQGGRTYHYECPKHEYEALKNAESAGKHFAAKIRPRYRHMT